MGLAPIASQAAGIDAKAIDQLATEVEALLRKAAKQSADEYKARRQAKRSAEAALGDFNYVGSRHHY